MNIRSVLVRGFFLVALLGSCFYLAYVNEDRPVVHIARNVGWNDFISQITFLPEDSPQDSLDKEMLVIQKFLKTHETEVTVGIYDLEVFKLQKADRDLEALRNELSYKEEQAKLGR